MKFIIGKKIDMTQVWQGDKVVGVTRVQAGPCTVVQVKGDDKDGYSAVQVGFGERKEKNIAKPQLKHMKKAG
ncbi:MAG: 50S ribosomal protein L3, partial [Candidatus Falkowbacteria bacterium]